MIGAFITGAPGSGKTSLVLATGLQPDMRVIYEGQLLDGSSRAKIGAAIDRGLPVTIAAVVPHIEESFENTLRRFDRIGRGASIATMARIQDNTPTGLEAIRDAFGDRVEIEVHDIRDRRNPRSYGMKEGLQIWREELSRGSSEQRLYDQLRRIRREGRGSDDFERQARGRPIEARDARVASQSQRGDGDARDEPRRGGEGRGAGLLGDRDPDAVFDGAERIVAMNGSRLHEKRFGGDWTVMGSAGQGLLPSGIYRLDGAKRADPTSAADYQGQIVHADRQRVFQIAGSGVVQHEAHRFDQAPAIGETARIRYQQGRASLANRPPAASISAEPAKPADFGLYHGPITTVGAGTVTQLVGGKPIVHQLRYLTGRTGELAAGKTVAIDYPAGIGKVSTAQQQTQGRAR